MIRYFIAIGLAIFFGFLAFLALIIYSLDNEKFNKNPCATSGKPFFDSLVKRYNITSYSSSPRNYCYKCSYFDSSKVQCGIITCNLTFDEARLDIQSDSLIHNFGKIFWESKENQDVDTLYLSLRNNSMAINASLTKKDLSDLVSFNGNLLPKNIPDVRLIEEIQGEETGGGGDYERYSVRTLEIRLNASHDFYNFQSIAESCYYKYLQNGKLKEVVSLAVVINVDKPYGILTRAKECAYTYHIVP